MESEKVTSPQFFSGASAERRIGELTILYEVSRALQITLDEDRASAVILAGITADRGLGFNRALILLVDPEEKCLQGRLAIGPSSPDEAAVAWHELGEKHQTLGEQLRSLVETGCGRDWQAGRIVGQLRIPLADQEHPLIAIMRSREACLCSSGKCTQGGRPAVPELQEILGSEDFALAPLYIGNKDLGLLAADNPVTHRPIEPDDLQLLQIYAQAAGAAIENARLFNELKEKINLCERSNRALRENRDYLLQADRLSTIGKMATLLAHEIRTPLVSIGGFARRLLRYTPAEDPRKEELEIIFSEVTRLEKLVGEILGYCKLARPEFAKLDVNALICSVLLTMETEIEKCLVRPALDLDTNLPPTLADGSQLRQALINLIMNALDAMPSGGTLTITTSHNGEFLEIGISDTGVGIAREHWGRLFDPFFTTKNTGTGLGLAVVSQVVSDHHGSLSFESVPGKGTTFHIRLAVYNPGAAARSDSLKTPSALEAQP